MPSAPTIDAAYLEAHARRVTDELGWLQPLLDDPDSEAVWRASWALLERLGKALLHNAAQLSIGGASGGMAGTSTLTLSRAASGTSGEIPAGYPFVDARGVVARAQVAIPVSSGATSVSVPVRTDRKTELVLSDDDPGFAVPADGPTGLDGAAATVLIAPAGAAGVVSTTFTTVTGASPIIGAASDFLSVHGEERGLPRQHGESTEDYRQRIRNIPDAVTPFAIADVVQAASQRLGLPEFRILEPFNDGASAGLKDPRWLSFFSGPAWDADAGLEADFYDDPGVALELLDRRTYTAYFRIVAQDYVRDPDGANMYWDASYFDDPVLGFPDAPLDFPHQVLGALLSLMSDVAGKKPAGVNFDLLLREPDKLVGVGASSALGAAVAWTLTPPAGRAWLMAEPGHAGHDSPNPGNFSHHIEFTFVSALPVTTPEFGGAEEQVIPQQEGLISQIKGVVTSNGSTPVNLVAVFPVHEIIL